MRWISIIGLLLVGWLGVVVYVRAGCWMRWRDTGYDYKYTFLSGCLVQQSSGKWLPEDKVRPE